MRTAIRSLVLIALASILSGVALVASGAEAATLNTDFEVEAEHITASGTLLDSKGKAIKKAEIVASVDGKRVAATETRGNGGFEVTVPMPGGGTPGTTYRIEVRFPGNDKYAPARLLADYAVPGGSNSGGGSQPSPPAKPTKSAQPTPTSRPSATVSAQPTQSKPAARAAVLEVTPLPATVIDDSTITLSGRLTGADGAGIVGAGIVVSDSRGEVTDSYTITTDGGSFSTYFLVPHGLTGTMPVTLSFTGSEGILPASKTVTTTVETLPVASDSPSATPTATASATATATAEATPSPSESAEASNAVDAQLPSQPWFLVSLIGVGGLALITVATLVFRGFNAPKPEVVGRRSAEPGGLDFLDEELRED